MHALSLPLSLPLPPLSFPLTYMLGTVGALLAGSGLAEHEDALLHLVSLLMLVSLLVGAALDALLSNHGGCLWGEMVEGGVG